MPSEGVTLETEPDIEAQLAVMGITLEGLKRELEYRQQKKIERAYREQRLAAKINGERRMLRNADGSGGEVKFQIHPVFYHYWGRRLGYECWDDPQFVREMLRDNPEMRITSVSEKTTVIVQGFRDRQMLKNGIQKPGNQERKSQRPVIGKRGRWAA